MAVGFFRKVGEWLKQAVPKVVKAVPKVLEVAGNVAGTFAPTAGAALKATSQFLDPWASKLSNTTNKAFNGSNAQLKQIPDRSIEQIGQFANDGLQFMRPWMKRFKGKGTSQAAF